MYYDVLRFTKLSYNIIITQLLYTVKAQSVDYAFTVDCKLYLYYTELLSICHY